MTEKQVAALIVFIIFSLLGLIYRWQSITSDAYAACLKNQEQTMEIIRQNPRQNYDMPLCYF